jgi:hypothetical protein
VFFCVAQVSQRGAGWWYMRARGQDAQQRCSNAHPECGSYGHRCKGGGIGERGPLRLAAARNRGGETGRWLLASAGDAAPAGSSEVLMLLTAASTLVFVRS